MLFIRGLCWELPADQRSGSDIRLKLYQAAVQVWVNEPLNWRANSDSDWA